MKVSIVCPLYNKKDYIGETILSVIEQSYDNWEMIVVDDGSTDGSFDLVKKFAEADSRIKLFDRKHVSPNKGANVCRNIGIYESEGDYILFLDADDLLKSYCLRQRIKIIKNNPGLSFYVFNVAYCKGKDAIAYARLRPTMIDRLKYMLTFNKKEYFLRKFLIFDLPWHTSGPIWNKKYLESIKGFSEQLQRLQDPELHTRVLLDNNSNFEYLMNKTEYDVLHRTDDDRIVWDKFEFFRKRIDSINQYLAIFIPIVKKQREGYLYKLQGCLLEADTLAYRRIRDEKSSEEIKRYIEYMELSYNSQVVDALYNWKYRFFLVVFRASLKNKIWVKMKIPGILLLFYRKAIL